MCVRACACLSACVCLCVRLCATRSCAGRAATLPPKAIRLYDAGARSRGADGVGRSPRGADVAGGEPSPGAGLLFAHTLSAVVSSAKDSAEAEAAIRDVPALMQTLKNQVRIARAHV